MNTQSIKKNDKSIGKPVVGEEPARAAPSEASCDRNGDTRGGSEAQSDQGRSQYPNLRENLQTEPDHHAASEEGTSSLLGLSFPRKLWAVVENEAFKSVGWSEEGDTMKIEGDLFEAEVLHRSGADKIFEMDSLKRFICELNLHGFRKIRTKNSPVHPGKKKMMVESIKMQTFRGITQGCSRTSGGEDVNAALLRKSHAAREGSSSAPNALHTFRRRSQKTISLKEAPNKQAPQGQGTFLPAGVTGCPLALCPPEEHSVPCGECSPEDGNMVSLAGDRMEGSGQVSIRPSWYPDWGSVMSFYNKCSSMLKAALAAISLSDLSVGEREQGSTSESSAEEEQEGFRQNKCVICVLYKDSSRS
uniref:heat shock transcription factor, X-linked member 3-like n=1 Tax=Jaculus jaculus TaxID=51337 RepID=UPI001E1B5186|nr:heat shock transcription factor, X-linked member 3-like [Jaculus jaculus]